MSESQTNDEALREELVAYLDGELSTEQSRSLEERLSHDDAARGELQRMEKVWDLLDGLPRANVDDTFARTTVEMVSLAAQQDLEQERAELPKRNLRVWLGTAVAILFAGLVGFAGAALFFPDKNAALLRDLSVIDNLEVLQRADSVAFLQRLVNESTFPNEAEPAGEAAGAPDAEIPASVAERRLWIEKQGDTDRERLQRMLDRFAELPPAEQERLRELQAQLDKSPELRRVLRNYYDWLKNLQTAQRAELLALTPEKRFDEIQRLKDEQAKESLRRTANNAKDKLTQKDWQEIFAWIDGVTQKNQEQILKDLPEDRRKVIEAMPADSQMRRRALMGAAFNHWNSTGTGILPQVEPGEIDSLVMKLSPNAKGMLEKLSDKQKLDVVREWAGKAVRARMPQGRFGQFGQSVSEEELTAFFETLPKADKDHLIGLSREEMHGELRKRYFESHFQKPRPDGPFRPGGDRPRSGPNGDRPRPDRNAGERPPAGSPDDPSSTDRPPGTDRPSRGFGGPRGDRGPMPPGGIPIVPSITPAPVTPSPAKPVAPPATPTPDEK